MKTIIQEAQIFGPISTCCHYITASAIKLEKFENYQKRSHRNRYSILTTNGVCTLSIPLKKGKNNQQIITDVMIAYDENWTEKHIQTIKSAYGKSAYFEYYFHDLERLFRKKPKFLFDFNLETTAWVIKKLKLAVELEFTGVFLKSSEGNQNVELSTLDLRYFKNQQHLNFVKYPQVWNDKFDFISDLSILDLLFCTGPEASYHLAKMIPVSQ